MYFKKYDAFIVNFSLDADMKRKRPQRSGSDTPNNYTRAKTLQTSSKLSNCVNSFIGDGILSYQISFSIQYSSFLLWQKTIIWSINFLAI